MSVLLNFAMLLAIFVGLNGLKCYHTDKQTKKITVVESDEFKLCTIFPSLANSVHQTKAVSDGLKEEELDMPFAKFFEENDEVYKLLSICLYEKYDWPKVFHKSKRNLARKALKVETTLRCVCNYDLCNGLSSFSEYLNQLDM